MPLLELFEPVAVVLALAYLWLAARENLWCWACAFVSSALFVAVYWRQALPMEALLSFYYVVMAVVGWYEWRYGSRDHTGVAITTLPLSRHGLIVAAMVLAALLNGWLMQRFTEAAWPILDSFIAWASVINTVLVVRKVLENWLYWIVIDGAAILIYLERDLPYLTFLYLVYVVISVFGYLHWRRLYLSSTR